jgi:hypothetical protein
MYNNDDKKLLDEYNETEVCVCDGADNASLTGSTRDYLPGAPAEWHPSGPPDDWKAWPRKVASGKPKFPTVDNVSS